MAEPGSVAWLLSPAELVAACSLRSIDGLPHSTHVGGGEASPAHVRSVGLRALGIRRLVTDGEDGPTLDRWLGAALDSLTGEGHDLLATLRWNHDERHVVVVDGAWATSMIESADGIEVIVEPPGAALPRWEARLRDAALAAGQPDPNASRSTASEVFALDRWQAIAGGRPVRTTDPPLGARGAQAAAAGNIWEGACVRTSGAGYDGEALTWACDALGALLVEVDTAPVGDDGQLLTISAVDDLAAELQSLRQPFRDYLEPAGHPTD